MTWQDWAIAALRAITYTACIWSVLWLLSGPDQHPRANWFFVGIAFLMGFWNGRTTRSAP